jgi:DNA-binding NtrC family response regulator
MAEAVLLEKGETLKKSSARGLRASKGTAHILPDEVLNLAEMERQHITKVLEATGGNRTKAAELLGIGLRTLRRKLNAPE